MRKPRIMFIVPADYKGLKEKHVESAIFERDEGGYFERVVSTHPLGLEDKRTEFNSVHVLHETHLKFRSSDNLKKIWATLILPFFFVSVVRKLIRIAKEERVDIIRATDPHWIGLIALCVKKISGLPLCVSLHSDYDQRFKLKGSGHSFTFFGFRYPAVLLSRFIMSQADMVMPIRESLAQWAINNGAKPDAVRVIPHGIDFSKYDAINEDRDRHQRIENDKKIISFVGRLSKENYVHHFPEIIEKLLTKRDNFSIVLAGDGELRTFLEEQIKNSPFLKDHLMLLGFQDQATCFSLRKASDICLCLMGGFSLIEACAAARPVVAYAVEWHSELVINNVTGFLIDENDTDQVALAIDQLLSDQAAAIIMGKKASELVRKKYDLRITSEIKIECYKELLRKK